MDMFDLASQLFGGGNPSAQGSTITATGSTASADGVAGIVIDADVTPAEGTGEDTDQTVIDVPTSPSVAEGDELVVTLVGEGPLKTPIVMANPGSGDRMAVSVSNAETLAQQAEAVATATGQHFWPDDDGVHVTEVTQDEWNDAEGASYHSGANVLLNSLGQLFRDGLNNILAIVSGTTPGVAIYDGQGNTADNTLAEFTSDHVRIGGNVPDGTGVESAVQFFDQTETHDTDMTASTYFDGDGTYQTMQSTVNLSSTLADEGKAIDTGSSGTAALDLSNALENGISDVGEQHNEVHAALVADASYSDGDTTSHAAVRATASTLNGSNLSYAELIADALGIGTNEGAIDYYRAEVVKSAIVPVTLFTGTYAQTYNTSVKLSESASNFSRLMFVCENNDGERTSVTVTDPNGKYFNVVMLTIAGPSGTGTYAYMKAKSFSINGTSVTCRTYTYNGQTIYRHGSVTLRNGVAVAATQASEEIGIVKVLGWR